MAQNDSPIKTTGGRFILFSVCCLVDHPDAVRVHEVLGTQSVVLEVHVARDDYRRVVGQRGRTAEALRALLLNIGGKESRRYVLELIEPEHRLEEAPWSGWLEPVVPMPDASEE